MTSAEQDLLTRARSALLDALTALGEHADSVVVIGAQAIHLRTGDISLALAPATKDADLTLDPRSLADTPLVDRALLDAGFVLDPSKDQPGAWINAAGMPVDIMVPEALAGPGGRRSGRIPPHDDRSMRRAHGLEGCVADHAPMKIRALDPADDRALTANVAGLGGLVVAKAHKLGERLERDRSRAMPKDAHDLYRVLVATDTDTLAATIQRLLDDEVAGDATVVAVAYLRTWFTTPQAAGALLAGDAVAGVGDPDETATALSLLVADLLAAL